MNNYIPSHHLEQILSKTLIGRLFYLRESRFRHMLKDSYRQTYTEIFNIPNGITGKFIWKANINSFKNINIRNMENKLLIYNPLINTTILSESLNIKKTIISLKYPPKVEYNLTQNGKKISIEEVDQNIYKDLFNNKVIIYWK